MTYGYHDIMQGITVDENTVSEALSRYGLKDIIQLILKDTYELPYVYGEAGSNVMADGDSIIFVGGQKGQPSGVQYDGHLAFSNKAIKLDLITGAKQILEMNAYSGHEFAEDGTVSNGRGYYAELNKLDEGKYLVHGGFQYVANMEILNFNDETVKNIPTDLQIVDTDYGGLNVTPYFAHLQGNAMSDNGDIFFFGFNNGLYGMKDIVKFDKSDESISLSSAQLTIGRSVTAAHKLSDGRIIIIGGWDGTAQTTPDSATRRVEIFNPNDESIIRVSDYPEPVAKGQQQQIGEFKIGNDIVCANKLDGTNGTMVDYQYIISLDKWESGCSITTNAYNFNQSDYNFDDNNVYYGKYITTLTNGDIVYFKDGSFSSVYSDEINGYPVEESAKIYVFSKY